MKEKIVEILRDEISCLICSGEFCNCDGSHDRERREEVADKILAAFSEDAPRVPN